MSDWNKEQSPFVNEPTDVEGVERQCLQHFGQGIPESGGGTVDPDRVCC